MPTLPEPAPKKTAAAKEGFYSSEFWLLTLASFYTEIAHIDLKRGALYIGGATVFAVCRTYIKVKLLKNGI